MICLIFFSNQFNARELWVIRLIWWEFCLAYTKAISISEMDCSIRERLIGSISGLVVWLGSRNSCQRRVSPDFGWSFDFYSFAMYSISVCFPVNVLQSMRTYAHIARRIWAWMVSEVFWYLHACVHRFSMLPFACELYLRWSVVTTQIVGFWESNIHGIWFASFEDYGF